MKRIALISLLCAFAVTPVSAGLIGPAPGPSTPYQQFSDSPFSGLSFDWFYLEDFEDSSSASGPGFDVPGVTASAGSYLTASGFNTDSVDADDGSIDGLGRNGRTWFYDPGTTGITFTFDAGSYPTHAGLVWTDGAGTITFEAFDAVGISLGTLTGTHSDGIGNWAGTTGEDRFYGAIDFGGISKIRITNTIAGVEVDHLQYGHIGSTSVVPTPGALTLVISGLATLSRFRKRRAP